MIRAVLDTNVLASALVNLDRPGSVPGEILRRALRQDFALVVSDAILAELDHTVTKPYFVRRSGPDRAASVRAAIEQVALVTPLTATVEGVATHPEDDRVLATAVAGDADYLVTGDRQLQALGCFRGVAIVNPAAFLAILDASPEPRP